MIVVARDVVGTAHANASVATSRMKEWLDSGYTEPREFELNGVIEKLTQALGDMVLAKSMLSSHWTDPTTYVGTWDRPKTTDE